MTTLPRERLAALLGELPVSGAFSARNGARPDDLHVDVRGVGELRFPVSAAQARQLVGVGRPARYGQGTRTLVDQRVRDTTEIPKSRVKIDQRRWNQTLLPVLDRLRADLGLPDGARLKAELHSMLVYGPGQFFVPHQDSEKADDMVATLVVTLPAVGRGGSLVVEHAGQRATYRGSDKLVSFVAFYADCRHEVRPVKSGHRIVLTYNLLLRGDTTPAASPLVLLSGLADCLDQHFAAEPSPTTRLVYLLDHEYTARAFGWSRLKGEDVARVSALRAAASRAECTAALALAEIHETWNAFEPDWDGPRRWGHGGWWDDDEGEDYDEQDDPDPADYELDDLIESEVTLDRWIADEPGASSETLASPVGDEEICASTPSADLTPSASQYEGYMGNYGNTMDRWYRRGAVVVWPRRNDFAVRAAASPSWSLRTLSTHLRADRLVQAQEFAATLSSFWGDVVTRVAPGPPPSGQAVRAHQKLFGRALEVAYGLADPELALMLLRPFSVRMVAPEHAGVLARITERYGHGWVGELLVAWGGRGARSMYDQGLLGWIGSLPELCAALRDAGEHGSMVARLLLDDSWTWLADAVATRRGVGAPSRRDEALAELAEPIAALLTGAATVQAADVRDAAVSFLGAAGDDLLSCLVHMQRATASADDAARVEAGLRELGLHCVERLQARLSRPPRQPDDWSIELPPGCDCELCQRLGSFLADPDRQSLDWPLAQHGRQHVHVRIDTHELPVRHQTRRTGRPYTLVLSKTTVVFEREAAARRQDQDDLGWLRAHLR